VLLYDDDADEERNTSWKFFFWWVLVCSAELFLVFYTFFSKRLFQLSISLYENGQNDHKEQNGQKFCHGQ